MSLFQLQSSEFTHRHIGVAAAEEEEMLAAIGEPDMETLISKTVPGAIRMATGLATPGGMSENAFIRHIKDISLKNKIFTNFIGQGYYDAITPSVILRNVFENPGWYTQYTPYQAEISQGRLESLLNFQTMVCDLSGLPIANASLLDEATAAAEAMSMFFHFLNKGAKAERNKFFVDKNIFPQTLDVVKTRAQTLGIEMVSGYFDQAEIDSTYFGALVQYPNAKGNIADYSSFIATMHGSGGYVAMATDLLALTLLTPPGELGADVAIGSAQRFGVPLGYGGPHAAFFATTDEFKRNIPGRIIGVSVDAKGDRALRMALQTREQHIKREKATSNICTAQALLANMAAMYAVYHGPKGLADIAKRVHIIAATVSEALSQLGFVQQNKNYFDTIFISGVEANKLKPIAESYKYNFYYPDETTAQLSFDETNLPEHIATIVKIFAEYKGIADGGMIETGLAEQVMMETKFLRNSPFLTHPVFNSYYSETKVMRYLKQLENKDLSLNTSMISLGSCTMKLNAATEMMPLSWQHWSKIHPFAPLAQAGGYQQIVEELSDYLCAITALDYCSLQPNSGAQGEFAGLMAIKSYFKNNGGQHRNVIIIPVSAHGTNPASAVMAGFRVVVVKALDNGYIDVADLTAKAKEHAENLAGIMITYPSTYGVFEETIIEITEIIHQYGGQVYMDGANMNAQVGLTAPGFIGADVCHLNLHKTFAIPHGGGGPGMGPICVKAHLKGHLPGHVFLNGYQAANAVSAAPYGSASVLLISYAYIRMLGNTGLKKSTEYAILNANYMRSKLKSEYEILYLGPNGTCAHEFIIDLRPFKKTAGIEAEDIAKRLMDYGFHAPTLSFPVPGTIMIEPTESEDKAELDRFCDALLSIREEIAEVENGDSDAANNCLKNAPHTQDMVIADDWSYPYSREKAAFPSSFVRKNKFWPSVARVNNTHGDRNLICTCEPIESYMDSEAG